MRKGELKKRLEDQEMPKMTGASYMAEFLVGYGVRAIFFVPSILSRMLAEMDNLPIQRVLAHGEKAAAYMADGYARASGRPGVCAAQDVGAANLASGLRDAFMSHSPVIALTGGRSNRHKHKRPHQEADDYPLFVPLTKANFQVDQVERIPDLMRQAFREATTGTPGPVHLQLSGKQGDVENEIAELELIVEEQYARFPAFRPRPDPGQVRKMGQRLRESARPVIVAGGGARVSGAGTELLKLAEKLSIPIATSIGALALVPEDHPLYMGVPGTYSRSCANKALLQADLVLFVGSETGGMLTDFWRVPRPGTEVMQIGIDACDLGRNYPNSLSVLGDAKVTLQELLESLEPTEQKSSWVAEVRRLVAEWRAEGKPLRDSDAVPIRPERILKELSDWLPEDVLYVCDTGHSVMWTAQQLWKNGTGWDFIRCSGSLGWAFPASLGAKCAVAERPVVCFTGDGGFWYHLQELETAVRCGIQTVTVINNNNALNQEINVFTRAYDGKPSAKWGDMWRFTKVNFAKIAEEMGAWGIRVEKPGQLRSALDQALSCGRPAVVEVMSDMEALAPRAWRG
jgi:acetolactate synthase-1/2/3 large subunit